MMAREINKLTALFVKNQTEPGYYGDGGGLYLQVSGAGTKSWLFIYNLNERQRQMGLGSVNDVSLHEARALATEQRRLRKEGRDPIEERNMRRKSEQAARAKRKTFDECAVEYIEGKKSEWKNGKHKDQWENTIATYASPIFGDIYVSEITTDHVLRCLRPIWETKTNTASRLRGRIETILDWAATRDYRQGENPARFKGHLEFSLARPKKIAKVQHFPSLPYRRIGEFMKALGELEGVSIRALEFTILTVLRTSDVIGATWDEIDMEEAIWQIDTDRMKGEKGKEKVERFHRVPLPDKAMNILKEMQKYRVKQEASGAYSNPYVFPGRKGDEPMTNMAMLEVLRRMNEGSDTKPWVDPVTGKEIVTHGFRSTFKDWASDVDEAPDVLSEKVLAHTIGDETRVAYQRGEMLEKRRRLMERWAQYCATDLSEDKVVPIRPRQKNKKSAA